MRYILPIAGRTNEAVAPCESAMGGERSKAGSFEETMAMPKKSERRENAILVLLARDERDLLDEAAKSSALPLGGWMRSVCVREARKLKKKEA